MTMTINLPALAADGRLPSNYEQLKAALAACADFRPMPRLG